MIIALTLLATFAASDAPPVDVQSVARLPQSTKMICKRKLETGTLAKYTTVCESEDSWDRRRKSARKQTMDLQNGINNIPSE